MKVILEVEDNGKHYKLCLLPEQKVETNFFDRRTWSFREKRLRGPVYATFWGNTPNIEDMGKTEMRTKMGYIQKENPARKAFFEMIKAGRNLTFTK